MSVFPLCGVGSQESEGEVLLPALYQVEKDPLRHSQPLALLGQVERYCPIVSFNLPGKDTVQSLKQHFKPRLIYKLGPKHKGDRLKQMACLLLRKPHLRPLSRQLQLRQGGQGAKECLCHRIQIQRRLGQPLRPLPQPQVIQRRPSVILPFRKQSLVFL